NSWRAAGGGYIYSQELYDAISRAREAGHLFVAAAGNDGTNNDVSPLYPASYDLDNIVSVTGVSASNQAGNTGFPGPWNFGLISVDLGASTGGGTSDASSHTTGVAA